MLFDLKEKLHFILGIKVFKIIKRCFRSSDTPIGAVLMLHRIDTPDPNGIWYNQHLKLSPQTLREMVEYARRYGCHIVSLSEMAKAINQKKGIRRWITITLDDGYRDNFENGAPVFRQFNIPYTIYVCTKMVKGEMLYWWDILEQIVLEHNEVVLNDGRSFDCSTQDKKEQSFLDIREVILNLPQDNLKDELKALFTNYEINWEYGNDTHGLTWEQLNDLKKEPLATIGNHTYSHCAFTGLSDDDIKADINKAANEMKENAGIEMNHFAFPLVKLQLFRSMILIF